MFSPYITNGSYSNTDGTNLSEIQPNHASQVSLSSFDNYQLNYSNTGSEWKTTFNEDYFAYSGVLSWGYIDLETMNHSQFTRDSCHRGTRHIEIDSNNTIVMILRIVTDGSSCSNLENWGEVSQHEIQGNTSFFNITDSPYDGIKIIPDSNPDAIYYHSNQGIRMINLQTGNESLANIVDQGCYDGFINATSVFECLKYEGGRMHNIDLVGENLIFSRDGNNLSSLDYYSGILNSKRSLANFTQQGFNIVNFSEAVCSVDECILSLEISYVDLNGQTYNPGLANVWINTTSLEILDVRESPLGRLVYSDEFSNSNPTRIYISDEDVTINNQVARAGIIVGYAGEDFDNDGIPDSLDTDDDDDGIADIFDICPFSVNETFFTSPISDYDSDGCEDYIEDEDIDNDGLNSSNDECPKGSINWESTNITDFDGDGCFDSTEDFDDDNDGILDSYDSCPKIVGNSTKPPYTGCVDSDGDGVANLVDLFPMNKAEWSDTDGDGYGNNADLFPTDGTQFGDMDGDGFGDNPYGNNGDGCKNVFGNSSINLKGCPDTDGDGYSDISDGFPNNPLAWQDTDGDGHEDQIDDFPFNSAQHTDSDNDGYGDNQFGGLGSDAFPNDPTQWSDIDGDGYGDNIAGTKSDAFIADPTQWDDSDGDGYGDNSFGRQADFFPLDATQWEDLDGDGFGDNQSGNNPDPYLFDFDNDGYNDSIDPLPKYSSPGDMDYDGSPDEEDLFISDYSEWADADGDGEGDNADTDDDNDGWSDADEIRAGTDPFNSAEEPVDSFEIMIPGTAFGLGAWDLIGMLGGIPLFVWIGFGFVTRNGRTAKYEGLLREARTRDELEDVGRMWEYSLMLRMLGPHQGIRLERLRAELDDRFEAQNQKLSSIEPEPHDQTQMVEQAMQIEQKSLPSIESASPKVSINGISDGKGYEWYTDAQETSWYRDEGSNSEWQRFEA